MIHHRPAIQRMWHIARALRAGRRVTLSDLKNYLEVSGKTIMRDIDFLRDRLFYQIEWDSADRCYRLRNNPTPRL